ncbi:MAG: HAMP domain-containing protein, partial [Anaerolineae bacterium]|nr:HAMP domain-containing protein [Anaerolineae bacterium]
MNFNIRTKMLLSFALILLMLTSVSVYGLIQMDVLSDLTTTLYNHPLRVTRAALRANLGMVKMHRQMNAMVSDVAMIDTAYKDVQAEEAEVYKQLAIVDEWILGDEGKALIAETNQLFGEWAPIREEMVDLLKADQKAKATIISNGKGAEHVALLESKMGELQDYAANKAEGMYATAQNTRSSVITVTIAALLGAIVVSGGLGWFLSGSIARPLQRVTEVARSLATGNLDHTVEVKSRDEVGRLADAFQQMIAYLKEMAEAADRIAQGDLTT